MIATSLFTELSWGFKGIRNGQVIFWISRQPHQQEIHIFATCIPQLSQPMTLKNKIRQLNICCETHFIHIIYFLII